MSETFGVRGIKHHSSRYVGKQFVHFCTNRCGNKSRKLELVSLLSVPCFLGFFSFKFEPVFLFGLEICGGKLVR